jgi:uncharacterized membrane protein (UPF0127 family)
VNARTPFVARNADTGALVASRVEVADSHVRRAVGLLGRKGLTPGEALWIVPSRGVHTWCMRFPIDVVALDASGRVVDVVPDMKPWRVRMRKRGVVGVLEMEPGRVAASGTRVGHRIVFERAQ